MELIDSWVLVPNLETLPSYYLFSKLAANDDGLKRNVEMTVKLRCIVCTLGQRSKDWFMMRLFTLTGTLFALGLLSSNHFRLLINLKEKENIVIDNDWKCKILDEIVYSLFFQH